MRNKEGLVDDLITSIPGEWKFDEQVSQHFDTVNFPPLFSLQI